MNQTSGRYIVLVIVRKETILIKLVSEQQISKQSQSFSCCSHKVFQIQWFDPVSIIWLALLTTGLLRCAVTPNQ
jgi:hypothetical protein